MAGTGDRGRQTGQKCADGAEARMNGQGLGALALPDWFRRAWLGPGLAGRHKAGQRAQPWCSERGAWSDAEGQGDLLRIHAAAHPPVSDPRSWNGPAKSQLEGEHLGVDYVPDARSWA